MTTEGEKDVRLRDDMPYAARAAWALDLFEAHARGEGDVRVPREAFDALRDAFEFFALRGGRVDARAVKAWRRRGDDA